MRVIGNVFKRKDQLRYCRNLSDKSPGPVFPRCCRPPRLRLPDCRQEQLLTYRQAGRKAGTVTDLQAGRKAGTGGRREGGKGVMEIERKRWGTLG